MTDRLPLSALLARSLAALNAAYRRAGTGNHANPSLAMWRTLLSAVTVDRSTEAELQQRTCTSRRALRSSVTGAVGAGWILAEPSGERGAGKTVRLTEVGIAAHRRWPEVANAAEQEWHGVVGKKRSDLAHATAAAIVSQFDLVWPNYPVSYGGADPSVTGGSYRSGSTGPPRIPAHGQNWKPVVRQPSAGVDHLPVDAILSQALVAFASDYEQNHMGAIPIAMALRHGTNDWVAVSDFPPEAGVTGQGKSLLERHGIVDLRVDPSAPVAPGQKGNMARPSAAGRAIRDSYGPITKQVESDWRKRYGAANVDRLRELLEELESQLPRGLPDYVITTRVLV